ncbi:unnamed protein product, partial [Nesidiocoris tenuis]
MSTFRSPCPGSYSTSHLTCFSSAESVLTVCCCSQEESAIGAVGSRWICFVRWAIRSSNERILKTSPAANHEI